MIMLLECSKQVINFHFDKFRTKKIILGSIHYFRMNEVCKIVKKSDNTQTDEIGYASFAGISFQRSTIVIICRNIFFRGPQGNYQYQYNATNGSGISDPKYVYINSEVLNLEIINDTYPPSEQNIGTPFTVQPIVRVSDYYGQPLSNKYVVAVSWPEPFVPQTGVDSYQNAYMDGKLNLKDTVKNIWKSCEICFSWW